MASSSATRSPDPSAGQNRNRWVVLAWCRVGRCGHKQPSPRAYLAQKQCDSLERGSRHTRSHASSSSCSLSSSTNRLRTPTCRRHDDADIDERLRNPPRTQFPLRHPAEDGARGMRIPVTERIEVAVDGLVEHGGVAKRNLREAEAVLESIGITP